MPPSGYLTTSGIENALVYLAHRYPTICQLIVLPEQSHEGRTSRAVRIGKPSTAAKRGALFVGGLHAREIVNPDLLIYFVFRLCRAYAEETDLVIGATTFDNWIVDLVVENLDLFVYPLVNPDGRTFVQTPGGDAWWRKNRNPNPGKSCRGVDLNRNFDFLWSSGIGTSTNSCSQTYRGAAPFSEPETRNIRHLLDTYPSIGYMLDIHSYSELILYPWGDDHNQTTDPNMNFRNPIYNGLRGTAGAGSYREFMPETDLDRFVLMGNNMRDKIDDERGRVYSVQQGMDLYPTTGTSEDYAYGRHFVDPSKRRITAFVLETGSEFQPPFTEGIRIIKEVSTGLINFCTNCLCVSEAAALLEHRFIEGAAGRRYADLFERHIGELIELTVADDRLLRDALVTLQRVNTFVAADELGRNEPVSAKLVKSIDKLLGKYERKAGDPLKKALGRMRNDVKQFGGKTIEEGMTQLESTKEPA